MNRFKRVTILVDNDSWVLKYAESLSSKLLADGISSKVVRDQMDIFDSDVCFFLGCTKIVSKENLKKSKINLVVHESDLPKGRGFAPVAWQILEGKKEIPICLLSAEESADSGDIWIRDHFYVEGTDLCDDWRAKQGDATVDICYKFITQFEDLAPIKQSGEPSLYERRRPKDSELDLNRTLGEQFELLRVVDNVRYPAFFYKDGIKFKIEISKYE